MTRGIITVDDFIKAVNVFGFKSPVVTALWNTMESNPNNNKEFETVYAMRMAGRFDIYRDIDSGETYTYDELKKTYELSADTMKCAKMPNVEILLEMEAGTDTSGKAIPATVTIRKEDFDQLQRTAGQLAFTRQPVDQLKEILDSFEKWAAKAFMNIIDTRQILADQKVREIQADLDKANRLLSIWKHDCEYKDQVIKGLRESAALGERFTRIWTSFPVAVDRLERISALERKFKNHGLSEADIRKYQDLCDAAGVDPRWDITGVL